MIYLGSDHGGFELKEKIKKLLGEWGYPYEDLGNTVYDQQDDYPEFAFKVAQKTAQDLNNKGILACRSAAGMVIAANKVRGIRAVSVFDKKGAEHSRLHNDANVLALSGDWLKERQVKEIVKTWLTTEFSGEVRHARRIKQIADFER